ncbi:conserved hypothetical protein [Uncinocarpus reesii 1704]|uniref:Carbohydrate kinase PfkB domain-containing protein n=1 Tax=Uncinocarpus reesii (strain UAMH 1704) TaxID=336963 RepID=C4JFE8_UNCRE|nr:uncharacterized protein UREG_00962 [Uncinocarpus reesii 1704]EEP76113.1 conserved hypothetical protein [Uncinocarpus reesii 1704]
MPFLRTATRAGPWVDRRVHGKFINRISRTNRYVHRDNAPLQGSNKFLKISEEVQDAVATGKPVVALETTIYTHGFPYPENVNLAKSLEAIVRDNGGVPATIGVLNGIARVGMNAAELTELTSASRYKNVLKVSRRDLGYICGVGLAGKRMHGGTTIAGTMILAHLAGIKVFATGGLADLTELGRTPVAVISSGCKSFLDIRRTLEVLETQGVVVGIAESSLLEPCGTPQRPQQSFLHVRLIELLDAQSNLQLSSGILFTNPVPEKHSFLKPEMDAIIAKAVELSHLEGVHGSDNTPFVLAKIKELSGGRSVETNKALAAVAKSELKTTTPKTTSLKPAPTVPEKIDILVAGSLAVDLACDFTPTATGSKMMTPALRTSNPSVISQSLGGVGYNVALASSYLGSSVLFCSVVADDLSGRSALAVLEKGSENLRSEGIQRLASGSGIRTAQYIAINDAKKELVLAMADMSILELHSEKLNFDEFWEPLIRRTKPTWAVIDTNWSPETVGRWIRLCKSHGIKTAVEPVSAPKATRLFSRISSENNKAADKPIFGPSNAAPTNQLVDIITPNRYELASMHTTAREAGLFDSPEWWKVIDSLSLPSVGSRDRFTSLTSASIVDEGIPQQSIQLLPFIPCIVTKLGQEGVLVTQLLRSGDSRLTDPEYAPYILGRAVGGSTDGPGDPNVGGVYMRLFPAAEKLEAHDVVSVNGAGDTLLGVLVSALAAAEKYDTAQKIRVEDVIPLAQQASIKTLKSECGVSSDIKSLRPLLGKLGSAQI